MHLAGPKIEAHDPGHVRMNDRNDFNDEVASEPNIPAAQRSRSVGSTPEPTQQSRHHVQKPSPLEDCESLTTSQLWAVVPRLPSQALSLDSTISTQHHIPTPYTSRALPNRSGPLSIISASRVPQGSPHSSHLDHRVKSPRAIPLTSSKSTPLLNQMHHRHHTDVPPLPAFEVTRSQVLPYQPILEQSGFRLIEISLDHTAAPDGQTMITCTMTNETLMEPPPYVAISYAWGNSTPTQKIIINGSFIPIAESLFGALGALRNEALYRKIDLGRKVSPLRIWADALCINQQDEDERNQQIRLMTDIYSNAKSVAIWLGPEEDCSDLAIRELRNLRTVDTSEVPRFIKSGVSTGAIAAIVGLFERDYWRRLWVVQEISNAKSIRVYCGSFVGPWEVFSDAPEIFSQAQKALDYYFPGRWRDGNRRAISLNQFSYSQVLIYQGPGSLSDLKERPLLEVLRACRSKLASEVKDKVFGVYGILPQEVRQTLSVNYSSSVKDIYMDTVKYILKTTSRLDVICEAINFPIYTGSANLPSYVPNWSHIPQMTAMGHKYGFSAAGQTLHTTTFSEAPQTN